MNLRLKNILILSGGAISLGGIWVLSRFWGGVWRCPFKAVTGLPCPGCGGLRAFELMTHGHFGEALATNPLSVLLMAFFAVSGIWLVADIVLGRRSWLDLVSRKWSGGATVIAIALLLLNWAWNICKGL